MRNDLIIPPFDIDILEQRMRPGSLSQGGFLGINESLPDVLNSDIKSLEQLGISFHDIGNKLDSLLKMAISKGDRFFSKEFKVVIKRYTGFQLCPWTKDIHHDQCRFGYGIEFGSIDWTITNLRNNCVCSGPGLAIHLIRDHHFFQGLESPYRVSPYEFYKLLWTK